MGLPRFLLLPYVVFLSFCMGICSAQQPDYSVTHYTSKNGLPENSITNMALDHNGFLWLTTQDGICRYDGQGFRLYNKSNTPGILNNRFVGVAQMNNGDISFMQDYVGDGMFTLQPDYTIAKDSSLSKNKFLSNGLRPLVLIGAMPQATNFTSLTETGTFDLVGGNGTYQLNGPGLSYTDPATKKQTPLIEVNGGNLSSAIIVPRLFKVYNQHQVQCVSYGIQLRCIQFDHEAMGIPTAGSKDAGRVWVPVPTYLVSFSDDNIYLYYNDNGRLSKRLLFHNYRFSHQADKAIDQVVYDMASGTLFIGSDVDGLFVLKPKQFHHFATNNIIHNSTSAQILLNNGNIIGGEDHYNIERQQVYPYKRTDKKALFKDADGSVYYTSNHTLYKSDKAFKQATPIRFSSYQKSAMEATAFLQDAAGRLWFSNQSNLGIIVGDSLHYKISNEPGDGNYIQFLFEQSKDTIWVLRRLSMYAYLPGSNTMLQKPLLSNVVPRTAFRAADGSTWVGTYGNGFYKYVNGKFIALPPDARNYLHNAHSFYEDHNGFFWITTNNGLFQCKKTDLDAAAKGGGGKPYYYHYISSDGFATDEFNGGFTPAYLQYNGRVVYPSMDGVVHFFPDSIHPVLPVQPVFIDRVWVDEATVYASGQLLLPPDFNQLKFDIESPFYGNPQNLVMEYRLEGLNDKWLPVENGKSIVYNRLRNGNYTLVIRKQQGFGIGNYVYKRFAFTVLPYWYETWWSKVLLILVIVAAVAFLFWLRQQANTRRAAMEAMLNEQQLKALRAQINPHFLQNTFEFLGHQMMTAPNDTTIDTMHRISAYLRHVLYRSDEAVVSLEDELNFIEEYLQVQQLLMRLNFTYAIHSPGDIDLYDIEVPSMLIQPVVENALKYGLGHHEAANEVSITLTGNADYVCCTVSDTGSGTNHGPKPAGYISKGLTLTLERMRLLYKNKKNQPSVHESINFSGGWDVAIYIPLR